MAVRFGPFRLDPSTRQLFRDDVEVHLSPKAYELLRRLIDALYVRRLAATGRGKMPL